MPHLLCPIAASQGGLTVSELTSDQPGGEGHEAELEPTQIPRLALKHLTNNNAHTYIHTYIYIYICIYIHIHNIYIYIYVQKSYLPTYTCTHTQTHCFASIRICQYVCFHHFVTDLCRVQAPIPLEIFPLVIKTVLNRDYNNGEVILIKDC